MMLEGGNKEREHINQLKNKGVPLGLILGDRGNTRDKVSSVSSSNLTFFGGGSNGGEEKSYTSHVIDHRLFDHLLKKVGAQIREPKIHVKNKTKRKYPRS